LRPSAWECDLQTGIAIISLRWRLRFIGELVSAEEARHVAHVDVGLASRTDFLVRSESRCDGRRADGREDRWGQWRERRRSGRLRRFSAGAKESEEQENAEDDGDQYGNDEGEG